jgi:hypothetical protein
MRRRTATPRRDHRALCREGRMRCGCRAQRPTALRIGPGVVGQRRAQVVETRCRVVLVGLPRSEWPRQARVRIARRDHQQRACRIGDRDRVRGSVRIERADVCEDVGFARCVPSVRFLTRGVPGAPLLAPSVQILVHDRHTAHLMPGVLEPHPDRVHDRVVWPTDDPLRVRLDTILTC